MLGNPPGRDLLAFAGQILPHILIQYCGREAWCELLPGSDGMVCRSCASALHVS